MPEHQEFSMNGIRNIMITRLNLDLSPEEITPEASLQDDLGFDSIDLLEIAVGIEKTYKIKITQKDTAAFQSLRTLYEFCQARVVVSSQ